MAEVFKRTEGGRRMPIQRAVALARSTQNELGRQSQRIAAEGQALLAGHEHDGHARVYAAPDGKIDHYVYLDDTAGKLAALSIEFGRKPNAKGKGAMKGLFILHRAAGLQEVQTR